MTPSLTIKPLDYRQHKRLYNSLKIDKDLTTNVVFEGDKLKDEYFDKYEGIYAEISQVTRFDESTDLSTTYIGKMDMTRDITIKGEEKFPISGQGYTNGKLVDNTECSILIDTPIWQSYINTILNCFETKKYCEAIVDDLLLFMPSKQSHMIKLKDLLKALLKNGLQISPKKCQLFRKELKYMGNIIFIQEKRVCIRPIHNRLEAIQRL